MTSARLMCFIAVLTVAGWAGSPKRVSQSEAMAAAVSKVTPEYPALAKQLKLTGTVEVEVVIAETGAVESVTPVSGNPVLTKPASEALKHWKFKPFQENGSAIKVQADIKVAFNN